MAELKGARRARPVPLCLLWPHSLWLYLTQQVNTALDSLPFVKDTLRLRQRDTQLVQQLADLAQVRPTALTRAL